MGEALLISETDFRTFDVLGYTLVPESTPGALLTTGLAILRARQRR